MLEHSQLSILLSGKNDPLWICNIPERARIALGCSTGAVYLSKYSAKHILGDHNDIDDFEILLLPLIIQRGRLFIENTSARFVNSIYKTEDDKIYFVSMKTAAKCHELWVSSMYKLTPKKMLNKIKRGTEILTGVPGQGTPAKLLK
jgi:hypothetical protein